MDDHEAKIRGILKEHARLTKDAASLAANPVELNIENCLAANNASAAIVSQGSLATVRVSDTTVTDNTTLSDSKTFNVSVSDPSVTVTGGFVVNDVEGAASGVQTVATFKDPGGPEALGDYSFSDLDNYGVIARSFRLAGRAPSTLGVRAPRGMRRRRVRGDARVPCGSDSVPALSRRSRGR